MSSLFVDLYKYRERVDRSPLEDFLTESLCAIMRALPHDKFAEFVGSLTGQVPCHNSIGNVTIETQRVIAREGGRRQRPDIIISIDGRPWLLFENKVSSGVHKEERLGGAGELVTQLHRYAEWLRSQEPALNVQGLNRALVFVTHNTPIPDDFRSTAGHRSYGVLGRHSATWACVGRILLKTTSDIGPLLHARALVEAFNTFLKEKGMDEEYPSSGDVALLGLYMPTAHRVQKLVNDMLYQADNIGTAAGNRNYAVTDNESGRFEATRYIKLDGWPEFLFICVGLWFPDAGDGWCRQVLEAEGIVVTSSPKVFYWFARDTEDGLPSVSGKPVGEWTRPNNDFLSYRDFDSFVGSAEDRHNAILGWVDERVIELKAFVQSIGAVAPK